jgi:hypothetical protein
MTLFSTSLSSYEIRSFLKKGFDELGMGMEEGETDP